MGWGWVGSVFFFFSKTTSKIIWLGVKRRVGHRKANQKEFKVGLGESGHFTVDWPLLFIRKDPGLHQVQSFDENILKLNHEVAWLAQE